MSNETVGNEEKYYVRIKGRVVGPYTLKQLNTLRVRGQFSQSNEISSDGHNWESAGVLESLFGSTKKTKSEVDAQTHESASVQSGPWHYSINGDQLGPTTSVAINQMLERGELGPDALLWKEGMGDWTPISEIPEFKASFNFSSERKSKRKKRAAKSESPDEEASESTHVFDVILKFVKEQFDGSSMGGFRRGLIEFGHYAAYVCIFLNAMFCLAIGVKSKSLDLGLLAIAIIFGGMGLQYAAVKFCYAIKNLILTTKFTMSSRTFFDVMSVTFAIGGVVQFAVLSVQAIHENSFVPILIGLAVFVACFRIAVDSLFPEAMGYHFKKETRAGEEALSIFAYFSLLPVRVVASMFSMGVAISSLGVLVAFFLLFSNGQKSDRFQAPIAEFVWAVSFAIGHLSLLAPILGYIWFVSQIVLIDLLRSILEVPRKLDLIKLSLEEEPGTSAAQDNIAS